MRCISTLVRGQLVGQLYMQLLGPDALNADAVWRATNFIDHGTFAQLAAESNVRTHPWQPAVLMSVAFILI